MTWPCEEAAPRRAVTAERDVGWFAESDTQSPWGARLSVPEAGDDPDEDESEDHSDGSMVLGSSWRSEPMVRWVRG